MTVWTWCPRARKTTCLAPPPNIDSLERRQTPRYRCRLACSCDAITLNRLPTLGVGQLADISADGLRLIFGRPLPLGTFLALGLRTPPGELVTQLRAQVVHSTRHDTDFRWVIGCKLSPMLSEIELDDLL
ncbi:hypothetical protein AYO44_18710 [Planctomycetaceae bacterium SCGC AG-212-F19]|nr:hypothetical protein AYO44_18710 [Planctomycetaceae bacterium SCGC AG-212-F19]